jgi:hypothetical protein
MKFALLILILIGLLAVLCEKNGNNDQEKEDEIVYTDIIPDIEIQSVRFFEPSSVPLGCPYIPTPSDSIINYNLDIDSDSVEDYTIKVRHRLQTDEYCGHCYPYQYTISIEGANNDSICLDPVNRHVAFQMNIGVEISDSSRWGEDGFLSLDPDCPGYYPYVVTLEDKYIGVKTKNMFGWINVAPLDNNGIKISEYAINKTEGNIIKTGQME